MAYVAFDETGLARLPESVALDRGAHAGMVDPARGTDGDTLSGVEWSVVAIARFDRLSSLRPAGRIASVVSALFGQPVNPGLSDGRLEALRRMAVLAWHQGYTVPTGELRTFLNAGFTTGQYEAMQARIGAERAKRSRRR